MPKITWKNDCSDWKLTIAGPQERSTWRSGKRSAICAASQLPGRGPLMWMVPLHLYVNQKSDYDMMMTVKSGWPIVYIEGSQVIISKEIVHFFL